MAAAGGPVVGAGGIHDVGGNLADDLPLDVLKDGYVYKHWERQVHGLFGLLTSKGLMTTDELRRGVEALPAYDELSYYERWAASMVAVQVERGTLTQADLDKELGLPLQEAAIQFAPGDVVRVKAEDAAVRYRKPHLRTPGYIFGLLGVVERECIGAFADPERVAFRSPGPKQALYRVRFSLAGVWEGAGGYGGGGGVHDSEDTVDIEIYQPWLEPATLLELSAQREQREARRRAAAGGPVGALDSGAGGRTHHGAHDLEHHSRHIPPSAAAAAAVAIADAAAAADHVHSAPPSFAPSHHHTQTHREDGVGGLPAAEPAAASAHGHAHDHAHDDHSHGHMHDDHAHGHTHAGHAHDHAHDDHAHGGHAHSHSGAAHDHGHSHSHGEGEEDHVHEGRVVVEQNALNLEGGEEEDERSRLAEAFTRVLVAKGVVTRAELRQALEVVDKRGTRLEGPRIVARAWVDPEWRRRLFSDATAALAELGIAGSHAMPPPSSAAASAAAVPAAPPGVGSMALPKPTILLTALENTEAVHNLIVCTLCSCYPLAVLGMSPPWYKSRGYRARAVRDPRGVLAEFGTTLPPGVAVRVHDSTADLRYIVVPSRPAGTEGWSEERLQRLVTRDSMIGVTFAKAAAELEREEEAAAAAAAAAAAVPAAAAP